MPIIGPSMCKIAHKHLIHLVENLCHGLGLTELLVWFMVGPSCSSGYLNPLPMPFTPPHLLSTHPLICATRDLSKILIKFQQIQLVLDICLFTESQ